MSTTDAQGTELIDPPADRPETEVVGWHVNTAPHATSSVRKIALFRETPDGWVLQHVRTVTVSQRAPSWCEIDTEADLEALPGYVQASLPVDVQEVIDGA